ncbi:MAG: PilZ domain-containing protein [Acidobacteria bacterium]|nr:PilZ domain-containing protein [Acidobacteriota bacterium]
MRLSALLVSENQPSLKTLSSALEGLGFKHQTCLTTLKAMEFLAHDSCSALLVDFDLPGAARVAKMARAGEGKARPMLFAILGPAMGTDQAVHAGANFILRKPLGKEQLRQALSSGRELIQREQRKSPRHEMKALVHLQFQTTNLPAFGVNLSEQGMALQAPEPLPQGQEVRFRFVLPESPEAVQGTGNVIWADEYGRAGMFFSSLSPASRKHLKLWLARQRQRKKSPGRRSALRSLLPPLETTLD